MMRTHILEQINDKISDTFSKIDKYCLAIYFGGSHVDPIIESPHDYDFICFAKPYQQHHLLRLLKKYNLRVGKSRLDLKSTKEEHTEDFSQVRIPPYGQIT